MNESINPLFIAGIISLLWKPHTQNTHSPRAAPWSPHHANKQRLPFAFEHSAALQYGHGPGWLLPTSWPQLLAIQGCFSSLSSEVCRWQQSCVGPKLHPAQRWHWAGVAQQCVGTPSSQLLQFPCYLKTYLWQKCAFTPNIFSWVPACWWHSRRYFCCHCSQTSGSCFPGLTVWTSGIRNPIKHSRN